uniref:glucosyltransferase domain-containing protein n=1 Tax=Acetatifactor sp. TaxID=1872090 RepID=UPI00405605DA
MKIKQNMKKEWKIAFFAAFLIGVMVHLPAMLSDVPNHDGLGSMYFDQNMITSGRWFLTIACGFSSYFTVPWVIGLLGLFFLACAAAAMTEILELKRSWIIVMVSGLLVVFPALASTFAYVFTLDGYMMALLLAVLAVLLTKKYRYGFVGGAVCLAFSMGIYQAYVAFAILLCIYVIVIRCIEEGSIKEKLQSCFHYLGMGVLGCGLYYIILQVLLKAQGKHLADYQGISDMGVSGAANAGIFATIKEMYVDFAVFTMKGNIIFNNIFSIIAIVILLLIVGFIMLSMCFRRKWWKNPFVFVIIGVLILGLPLATNAILLISPNVNYHLLMRYQWIVYPIVLLAFCERYMNENKISAVMEWCLLLAGTVLVFNYSVTDNIAYSNLQKRYEKTYAYCVRLLDRIEQTEGYYQGIPIAMVGVVGDDEYPVTDITLDVTGSMIGIGGDSLLYTGPNYEVFIQNYLGATLNIMEPDEMSDIYYSEEYIAMDSFPGPDSTKVVDGILYVRTENIGRD